MSEQPSLFDDQPLPGEYTFAETDQQGRCASCGRVIVWIVTANSKRMPLDLTTTRLIDGRRYAMNHFATCVHGKDWSRKR